MDPLTPLETEEALDTAIVPIAGLAPRGLTFQPLDFWPLQSGTAAQRRFSLLWLAACALIVPSGLLTRLFEWTGMSIQLGGIEAHITVYLPMLACVPLALWFGYPWAAIPAYLSTFAVAWVGGMPLGWIFLFAFANPLGLAVLVLCYRSVPIRIDLRSPGSAAYFAVVIFASSIAGSVGSFVWAYTNAVGLNDFFRVWQGWWLGGFLQGIFVVGPFMTIVSPRLMRWKRGSGLPLQPAAGIEPRRLLAAAAVTVLATAGFVLVVRRFSVESLREAVGPEVPQQLINAFAGLSLTQWVLLTLMALALVFGYQAGVLWSSSVRELAAKLAKANRELAEKNRALESSRLIDPLTQVGSRLGLFAALTREIGRARRSGTAFSCLMMDLDQFKKINDELGHAVGDAALKEAAKVAARQLRAIDVIARYGGDEFAMVLPGTDRAGALRLAERVRASVREHDFSAVGVDRQVTISVGLASFESTAELTPEQCLQLADQSLLEAKQSGRDRVVSASS